MKDDPNDPVNSVLSRGTQIMQVCIDAGNPYDEYTAMALAMLALDAADEMNGREPPDPITRLAQLVSVRKSAPAPTPTPVVLSPGPSRMQ